MTTKTLQDELKPELLSKYDAIYIDEKGKERINCPNLAKLLLYGDNKQYIVTRDNQEILKYTGSYFEGNNDPIIGNRINYYLDSRTTNRIKSETLGFIKSHDFICREKLEQPLNIINVQNGIYNINTGKLIPHNPKYTFQHEIAINYDPKADCPIWKKFLENVLYQEDIDFIQEMCGYLLHRQYTWALIVILLGHGRNGKTTFTNVMSRVLGENNVEHIPLQTIAFERFAKAKLYQKHANLCSDLGSREIKDTGTLKQLTGMDTIFARELYKNGFNFRNFAKLMFACNILPEINDKTLAMTERLAVVEFPNSFTRGSEECDPDIIDKLTTEKELSGIFNWMVQGLKRLLKNKKFSPYRDFENVAEYLKASQDPINIFINTCIESDPNGEIPKEHVYKKYLDFCKLHNYPTLVNNWFSQKFRPLAPMGLDEGQPRKGGHKKTWKGIKFKNEEDNLTDKLQKELTC